MGSSNAQHETNLPKRAPANDKVRPGHDIEDLIVYPGCLEGENCHSSNCKLFFANRLQTFL